MSVGCEPEIYFRLSETFLEFRVLDTVKVKISVENFHN